jgi:hypothetical protein
MVANVEESVKIYEELLQTVGGMDSALGMRNLKQAVEIAGTCLNFAGVLQKRRGGDRDENARRALALLRNSHAVFARTNRQNLTAHIADRIAKIEHELGSRSESAPRSR